jgi:hypothetical protein
MMVIAALLWIVDAADIEDQVSPCDQFSITAPDQLEVAQGCFQDNGGKHIISVECAAVGEDCHAAHGDVSITFEPGAECFKPKP